MSGNQGEEDENHYQGILVEKPDESRQYWISKETQMKDSGKWCRYVIIEGKDFCLKRVGNGSSGDGFVTYEYDSGAKPGLSGIGSKAPESYMGDCDCVIVKWGNSKVRVKGEGSYSRKMGNHEFTPCTIIREGNGREYRGPLGKDRKPNGHGIVTFTASDGKSIERVSVT